jgi:hypothetical protein
MHSLVSTVLSCRLGTKADQFGQALPSPLQLGILA